MDFKYGSANHYPGAAGKKEFEEIKVESVEDNDDVLNRPKYVEEVDYAKVF